MPEAGAPRRKNAPPGRPVAATRQGGVSGRTANGVVRFLGIPFAGRVDGPGRFAPPQPPKAWDGVRPCLTLGPMAAQVADSVHRDHVFYTDYLFGRCHPQKMTEEGLHLNLWTPSVDPDARRPVLVWLHGGGFTTGVATRPREHGAALARRGDIVVVAPTHRLGLFGYAWFDPKIRQHFTPNAGLFDIIAALTWIQDNIRAFGGDPDKVTIMGESGGGMKVSALLVMPAARGLFHRAISLGGALVSGHAASALTQEQTVFLMERITQHLGVVAADLQDMPMEILLGAQAATNRRPVIWRPVIDGETLPGHPDEMIACGAGADVPLLIGSSAHEGDFLSKLGPLFDVARPSDLAGLAGAVACDKASAYDMPDIDLSNDRETAIAMLGDFYLRMPAIRTAEAHVAAGRPAWMYLFDWTQPGAPHLRSTHGAETTFVFGNLEATGFTRGFEEATALSRSAQDRWLAFIRNGDPNSAGSTEWPQYSATHRATMRFSDRSDVVDDPGAKARRAWARTPSAANPALSPGH